LLPSPAFARSGNKSIRGSRLSNASVLSLASIIGDKKDFKLQKVDPNFTDADEHFYKAFEHNLDILDGKSSEDQLCIEDFLVKSEKKWFDQFRAAKLGITPGHSPSPSIFGGKHGHNTSHNRNASMFNEDMMYGNGGPKDEPNVGDQFLLGADYVPPTGLRLLLQYRIGDWPVYSFLLAFVSSREKKFLVVEKFTDQLFSPFRAKSSPPTPIRSPSSPARSVSPQRNFMPSPPFTSSHQYYGGLSFAL
jgi:alpha-1,3-glucan synthase